jgi:hypothetical protein
MTFDDLAALIKHIQRRKVLVMADCDSLESAMRAAALGADLIGTTLAGYTSARAATAGRDRGRAARALASATASRLHEEVDHAGIVRLAPLLPPVGEGRATRRVEDLGVDRQGPRKTFRPHGSPHQLKM